MGQQKIAMCLEQLPVENMRGLGTIGTKLALKMLVNKERHDSFDICRVEVG